MTVSGLWIMMREICVSSITLLNSSTDPVRVEGSARLTSPSVASPTSIPPTVTGIRRTALRRMVSMVWRRLSSGLNVTGFLVM